MTSKILLSGGGVFALGVKTPNFATPTSSSMGIRWRRSAPDSEPATPKW